MVCVWVIEGPELEFATILPLVHFVLCVMISLFNCRMENDGGGNSKRPRAAVSHIHVHSIMVN